MSYFWSYPLGIHLDSLVSVSDHLSPGHPLVSAVRSRSSLFWSASGTNSQDQIITFLVCLWNQQSGQDHPSSGQLLIPAVGSRSSFFWSAYEPNGRDQINLFLVSLWSNWSGPAVPAVGTRSSLFWSAYEPNKRIRTSLFWLASGANSWDQIIPLLVSLWFQQAGQDHPSSG